MKIQELKAGNYYVETNIHKYQEEEDEDTK